MHSYDLHLRAQEEPDPSLQPPKFGIRFLLLFTVICAALYAQSRFWSELSAEALQLKGQELLAEHAAKAEAEQPEDSEDKTTEEQAAAWEAVTHRDQQGPLHDFFDDLHLAVLANALYLTGLCMGVWGLMRGKFFPYHGGDWVWVALGINALLPFVACLLYMALVILAPLWSIFLLCLPLGMGWLFVLRADVPSHWKWVFVVKSLEWLFFATVVECLAVYVVTGFAWDWTGGASFIVLTGGVLLGIVSLLVVLYAVLHDVISSQRLPWTHWTGVALLVIPLITSLVAWILPLLPPELIRPAG